MKASKPTAGSIAPDASSLVLRLAVGPMLFAHGYNKVFGTGGLAGTTRWFEALGLRPAALHARVAAATEIAAGAAVTLGAASPYPAAAAIGLMATAAATDHRGKGFFVFKGGWEYTAVVGAAASALSVLGSGRYALGRHHRRGAALALAGAAAGIGASRALLAATYRPEIPPAPVPEEPTAEPHPVEGAGPGEGAGEPPG